MSVATPDTELAKTTGPTVTWPDSRTCPPITYRSRQASALISAGTRSELVTTMSSRLLLRCRTRASVVVPPLMKSTLPSSTSWAAVRPICSFWSGWSRERSSSPVSCQGIAELDMAPPWVRMRTPSESSWSRSRRMVSAETAKCSARAVTVTCPCAATYLATSVLRPAGRRDASLMGPA